MATKKITKSGTYNFNINSNSKDLVITLKNTSLFSSVNFNFSVEAGYNTEFANYFSQGYDIVLAYIYESKLVTVTIKDICKDYSYYPIDSLKVNGESVDWRFLPYGYARGLYADAYYAGNYIIGSNYSDSYMVTQPIPSDHDKEFYDYGGNDSYNVSATGTSDYFNNFYDYKGNDKYNFSNSTKARVEDYKGNDSYAITEDSDISILDKAGNDKYKIKDISLAKFALINEQSGNDKYEIINSYADINDGKGDDNYNWLSGSVDITDSKGKDSYNLINTQIEKLEDSDGNDKYSLTSVSGTITDNLGKDKYNAYFADSLTINDDKGADKYTVSNSSTINIKDNETSTKNKSANDSYTITSCTGNNSISDKGGSDKYTVTSSKIRINEYGTNNDSYNVDLKGRVTIADKGGTADSLKLLNTNKNNLIVMANYNLATDDSNSYNDVSDGSIFIFDKTNYGFIKIEDCFGYTTSGGKNYLDRSTKGSGYIEKVSSGKAKLNNFIYSSFSDQKTEDIGYAIAHWVSDFDNSYSNVSQILSSGTNEDIGKFMAFISHDCPMPVIM